jgi:hypothetical protein
MDKLFPIIRRQRRPLIVADVPPIPIKTEPVQSVVTTPPVEPAKSATPEKPSRKKSNDAAAQN